MIEKLTSLVKHYELVVNKMSDPKVVSDIEKYTELAREHRQLSPIIELSPITIEFAWSKNKFFPIFAAGCISTPVINLAN